MGWFNLSYRNNGFLRVSDPLLGSQEKRPFLKTSSDSFRFAELFPLLV
jgi:hypothetical protein